MPSLHGKILLNKSIRHGNALACCWLQLQDLGSNREEVGYSDASPSKNVTRVDLGHVNQTEITLPLCHT